MAALRDYSSFASEPNGLFVFIDHTIEKASHCKIWVHLLNCREPTKNIEDQFPSTVKFSIFYTHYTGIWRCTASCNFSCDKSKKRMIRKDVTQFWRILAYNLNAIFETAVAFGCFSSSEYRRYMQTQKFLRNKFLRKIPVERFLDATISVDNFGMQKVFHVAAINFCQLPKFPRN